MELYVSTGSRHDPGTDHLYFRYDVLSSHWLAFIVYDAFRLGEYSFPVHKSLQEIAIRAHRICNRHNIVRGMVANNLYYYA